MCSCGLITHFFLLWGEVCYECLSVQAIVSFTAVCAVVALSSPAICDFVSVVLAYCCYRAVCALGCSYLRGRQVDQSVELSIIWLRSDEVDWYCLECVHGLLIET